MPITVAMIEEKEFKTKMRGYDPVEVDEFLDDICDEMVAMQEEIATLTQRLNQASHNPYASAAVPAPAVAAAPVPPPAAPVQRVQEAPAQAREETSEAAQRLLAQAQKVYDQTIAEAKAKAEEILSGADERASMNLEDLEAEKRDLQQEVEMLRQTAKDYRERFLRLIEDQQHILNAETGLFE